MNFMYRMAINVELMISLIEQKPIVWDKTLAAYKDKLAKEETWKEICCTLNDEFEEMDKKEQEEYNKLVLRKWTQIRDSWMKSFKKCKRNGSKASRPYIYHDQMSFLEKIAGSVSSPNEESLEGFDGLENTIKEEITEEEPGLFDQSLVSTSSMQEVHKRKSEFEDVKQAKVFKYIDSQMAGEENRHLSFFKSLLPSLELFDDDQTLEFQGGVIRLLQTIKRGGYAQ